MDKEKVAAFLYIRASVLTIKSILMILLVNHMVDIFRATKNKSKRV